MTTRHPMTTRDKLGWMAALALFAALWIVVGLALMTGRAAGTAAPEIFCQQGFHRVPYHGTFRCVPNSRRGHHYAYGQLDAVTACTDPDSDGDCEPVGTDPPRHMFVTVYSVGIPYKFEFIGSGSDALQPIKRWVTSLTADGLDLSELGCGRPEEPDCTIAGQ